MTSFENKPDIDRIRILKETIITSINMIFNLMNEEEITREKLNVILYYLESSSGYHGNHAKEYG